MNSRLILLAVCFLIGITEIAGQRRRCDGTPYEKEVRGRRGMCQTCTCGLIFFFFPREDCKNDVKPCEGKQSTTTATTNSSSTVTTSAAPNVTSTTTAETASTVSGATNATEATAASDATNATEATAASDSTSATEAPPA